MSIDERVAKITVHLEALKERNVLDPIKRLENIPDSHQRRIEDKH